MLNFQSKTALAAMLAMSLMAPVAGMKLLTSLSSSGVGAATRPEGPCDVYEAAKTPCVAAHSTTRALYAAYNGPLYQVLRQSDGKRLDIGLAPASGSDPGGYADAAAQDRFCANTYCWITTIYDQSGHKNNLVQAPHGGFNGPAMGGFNNVPLADMAPASISGHKVYGVFIEPGMGLRIDDAKGTAVDDQAEGQYWVINGRHYNGGCCFDYGNAETDSRDDGNGTMETTYFGNATPWYHGPPPGPWVMTDQENNLVGCVNADGSKLCDLPSINWRFVTGIAEGEPHHWTSMGGDSQRGPLQTMFDGVRVNRSYDPMRKQGAILLGNGGDNSNGSQGTFYEGAMTAAGTFPSNATDQLLQANIVAAKYVEPTLTVAPASALEAPPGVQTFSPGSQRDIAALFRNTSGVPVSDLKLSLALPRGWSATSSNGGNRAVAFPGPIAPGAIVTATFHVTTGAASFNGDLVARASWSSGTGNQATAATEKVRNVSPVKINEFASNSTDSFIELYNAGDTASDISNWELIQHAAQAPIFSSIHVPAGTKLGPKEFYLLGLSNSGLTVPARKGDSLLYVRNTTGMKSGDEVQIGIGADAETRHVTEVGGPSGAGTTVWQPLPDGPIITIPAGSTNIPYSAPNRGFGGGGGFTVEVGQKIALGYGATYPAVGRDLEKVEVVTITKVGKPGTQAYLAADAKPGDTNIKVSSVANISIGDKIRLDIDSVGHGVETVTITKVGTQSNGNPGNGQIANPGTGLDIAEPIKHAHAANMPFSARGTGITFEPATKVPHSSNEPIIPLGAGITLDQPLGKGHGIDAVIHDASVSTAGYHGDAAPNQWFGGPEISPRSGSIVLRDSAGRVVDSLNYGGLADPWAAKGYQGQSPGGGCSVPSPSAGGFGRRANAGARAILSAGRIRDGVDSDNNCGDFAVQSVISTAQAAAAGDSNLKVESVAGLEVGQTITIDVANDRETAVISSIGTAGGTEVRTGTSVGATEIPVNSVAGFSVGQTVTIGSEKAIIASITRPRGFGAGGGSLGVRSALVKAHDTGAQVSGTGITLARPLTRMHQAGTPVQDFAPTPGAPNRYGRRS